MMLYPLFLLVVYHLVVWSFSVKHLVSLYMVVFVVSMVRSLFAVYVSGRWTFLVLSFYGLLFLHVILPVKIWAGLTIRNSGWGTPCVL